MFESTGEPVVGGPVANALGDFRLPSVAETPGMSASTEAAACEPVAGGPVADAVGNDRAPALS